MTKIKKGFTLIELLIVITIIGIIAAIVLASIQKAHACGILVSCDSSSEVEAKKAAEVQKNLLNAVPIPQLTNSLERENVSKRAQIFNTPNKISYIYLVSFGKVMSFFTVKGKVSSLQSYMVPTDRLVKEGGGTCDWSSATGSCYVVEAPDIDGTYGNNISGIFFFTTEGAYVEWKGDYMMSDQPLKLSTQPELIREIK